MRDPLDPANPYKDQYAPYDVWIYVQAWDAAQGQQMHYQAPGSAISGSWYSMAVDEDGWPVPLKTEKELYYSSPTAHLGCRRAISAYGFMGNSLEELQQQALLEVQAQHLPQVPLWLAERIQQQAMILPDGEVVSRGPLGTNPAASVEDYERYYRYSADGTELGSAPGPYWWRLYWPDFDEVQGSYENSRWLEFDGYITRYLNDAGDPLETWDYKGKRFRGVAPPAAPGAFEWLSDQSVRQLYELQSQDPRFSSGAVGI